MKKKFASCLKRLTMKITNCIALHKAILLPAITIALVSGAQSLVKKDPRAGILSLAYFIESANNSVNSLNSLLKKDNYRNKITTLNNPANNELGFSLKNEILLALKPILDKARKTDGNKFREVIENFLNNPEENGISSVKKYLPALGIFSTVLSLVGNLVIVEKTITKDDLNKFTARIQQYFAQYERMNLINEQFGAQLHKLLDRSQEMKDDIRDFVLECITTLDKTINKQGIRHLPPETLAQKYFDPQKLQDWLDSAKLRPEQVYFPPDAPTTVKLLTGSIKKLQKEFEALYSENYRQLKDLIASLKNTIPDIDVAQLEKTNQEIDLLYNESRQADVVNLNMVRVDERMNAVCRIIFLPK